MPETSHIITFLGALFAIMNPIGNVPIFIALTEDEDAKRRTKTAVKTVVASFIILVVVTLVGDAVLDLFGISVDAFRVAGGLIILLMALSMLHARTSAMHGTAQEKIAGKAADDPSIFPLAIPIIAGPGAMSVVIVFVHRAEDIAGYAVTIAAIAAMCVALFIGFRLSVPLSKRLGTTAMNVITRIMGIILAAIAIQMLATGIGGLLPAAHS